MEIETLIRTINDYPKEGIKYRDITTLLKDGKGFRRSVDILAEFCAPLEADFIAGIEARGFIFGSALAYKLNTGFIPIRKEGKLPHKTLNEKYELEYGFDCLEVHADAVRSGERVILIDDLLATGGTARAATRLLTRAGASVVGAGFLIELDLLKGREALSEPEMKVFSAFSFSD